jgi:hypothetical protein
MEIPAEVAKMVIGQGGKSIKDLQERTGAYVLIHKPEPGEPAGNSRQVRVKGRVASVDVAVAELRRKVMEFEYNRGGGYDDRSRGGAAPYGAPGGARRFARFPTGFWPAAPPRRRGGERGVPHRAPRHDHRQGGERAVARLEQETGREGAE